MADITRSAQISRCGRYRYSLDRVWGNPYGPAVYWIMLNPSTADAEVDDPTIRRCIAFSKRQGAERLRVVNLWPYRSTDPKDLVDAAEAGININGEQGEHHIDQALAEWGDDDKVVAAWGAGVEHLGWLASERVGWLVNLAHEYVTPLRSLGVTKAGHPRHPLYVRGDTPFAHWPPSAHYDGDDSQ